MGSKGGGETRTITTNGPPQILPEGKEGYQLANDFYKGILQNPPVYSGERVAPFSPAQDEALKQYRGYFGQPQPTQIGAENQVMKTLSEGNRYTDPITPMGNYGLDGKGFDSGFTPGGNYGLNGSGFSAPSIGGSQASAYNANISGVKSTYNGDPRYNYNAMSDEEMKSAIENASEPLLANLTEDVMPQIRNSSQLAGQGATSTRSDVARQKAVEGFGRTVGSSVIAPLMQQREQLTQDFDKAMQSYLQATAEGDANRAEQAQVEMARINAQSHDTTNQINAQRDIAGGDLQLRAQEGASREKIAGAGIQSQERIAGGDFKLRGQEDSSREKIAGAGLYSQDRNAYGQRGLQAWDAERNREMGAVNQSSQLMKDEAFRINQLFQSGLIDQTQYQKMLDANREQYEEPLYRQSQSAQALAGMSGLGPGSGESVSKQDTGGADAMQIISTIAMIGSIAAKAAS